jgi:uncharacterized protein YcfL
MRKNIIILKLLLLLVSCSTSKELIKLEHVSLKLPTGTKKNTKEQLNPLNKRDEIVMEYKNIYRVHEDIIITTPNSAPKHKIEKNYLLERKKLIDGLVRENNLDEASQYKSYIETVNNNEVLITYKFYDYGKYSFSIINKDNTQSFMGTITFENKSNYEKATKILNDLIKSVKFK